VRGSACGETYPISPPSATSSLGVILKNRIRRHGPIGFDKFMECALYHPELGYYAKGTAQTGRSGDFFTSVSVGPLFGHILARRFLRHWMEEGRPDRWRIIEFGAHDGTLAKDILCSLQQLDPQALTSLDYVIAEPLPSLQAAQTETLAGFGQRTRILPSLDALAQDPLPGLAFGNEVLDALPFHTLIRSHGRWMERAVALSPDEHFIWQTREIADPAVLSSAQLVGDGFPDGYLTEIRTCHSQFLTPIATALVRGLMIWLDYGFARPEYLHPDRTSGTLRTFLRHQAGEDPLASPGTVDITAHVDFTDFTRHAIEIGAKPLVFKTQGSWLGGNARDWLLEREGMPADPMLRQFQTLTHPGHLGASFHVLELTWDPDRTADDPETLAHRLAIPHGAEESNESRPS
jgi:SAM-dependent MidA family methyltransferase